jgi:glycosyltransferase involved in cell wall biosynthesis
MRIAFVNQYGDEAIPKIGGYSSISIISYHLALHLAHEGHEVLIYGKKGDDQSSIERDENGILYIRVSINPDKIFLKPLRALDRLGGFRDPRRPLFASIFHSPAYALQIARDIKKRQPDIIHIFNFSQYAPIISAFTPHAKIVLHMQCEWLTQLDQKLIDSRLKEVNLVIGCSDFITNKIKRQFPQFAKRCYTVYNGVSPVDFTESGNSPKNGGEKILFVGRVSPEKGVHILLDAFREVLVRHPQAQLEIVGPTGIVPYEFAVAVSDDINVSSLAEFYRGLRKRSHYDAYIRQQLLPPEWKQVNMVGGIPHSSVVNHYRDADIFAFTSVWDEPFGIPMVEAMACGLPVVAARGGAVPEIVINGKTGLLVERNNANALAQAIVRLLEDEELRKSMGRVGRQRASELFTWARSADKLKDLYYDLLDE